jgi:hypothetical protein
MLCSICKTNQATVHVYEVRLRKEREFCLACAKAEGLISGASRMRLQDLEALQDSIKALRARIEEELRQQG